MSKMRKKTLPDSRSLEVKPKMLALSGGSATQQVPGGADPGGQLGKLAMAPRLGARALLLLTFQD